MKRWASNPKFAPKSKHKRGANRRVTHNKTPAQRGMTPPKSTARMWSVNSMAYPNIRPPLRDNSVYNITQDINLGVVLTSSNVGYASGFQNFQFNQVPNEASWATVFDQYMITRIEFWLCVAQTNNGGHAGQLYSAVDYDSAAATTEAAIQQYQNGISGNFITGHYHSFVPHIAMAAYSGAFTSYANRSKQWIDSASPTVQHYGMVFGVSQTTDNGITFLGRARYHLSFRNVF